MHRIKREGVRRAAASVLSMTCCLIALCAAVLNEAGAASIQGTAGAAPVGAADHAELARVYLPLTWRSYRRLANGDFESGLSGWEVRRGPFSAHGSGLPATAANFQSGNRGLLGTSGNLAAGSILVGHGTIVQTFTLETRYVRLEYWVSSYDKAKGEARYFDTFEVSVNRSPEQISDGERDARGCASTLLNPTGTLTVGQDGLVFCGGRPGAAGQGTLWDTGGWKAVTLDLGAFRGRNVTLYFSVWSREYEGSFRDDHAWFNTWAYVDNVRPSDTP